VGRIAALNMYPVYHGLEEAAGRLRFLDGVPADLNAALLEGRVDVSAVSSIAYARNADSLVLLPVASITATGAVDSIQLFSNVPFAKVRDIAVTPHSATSVALLRILVGDRPPPFATLDEAPERALRSHDAVLLIGDEALEGHRAGLGRHRTDLAALWRERTGLPMVFAVWAARNEAVDRDPVGIRELSEQLVRALSAYEREPELVARAAAGRFPFPPEYVRSYLGRLRYEFGPAERAGLERFLQMAETAGLLEHVPELAA
jgi:chorismate dehydratase